MGLNCLYRMFLSGRVVRRLRPCFSYSRDLPALDSGPGGWYSTQPWPNADVRIDKGMGAQGPCGVRSPPVPRTGLSRPRSFPSSRAWSRLYRRPSRSTGRPSRRCPSHDETPPSTDSPQWTRVSNTPVPSPQHRPTAPQHSLLALVHGAFWVLRCTFESLMPVRHAEVVAGQELAAAITGPAAQPLDRLALARSHAVVGNRLGIAPVRRTHADPPRHHRGAMDSRRIAGILAAYPPARCSRHSKLRTMTLLHPKRTERCAHGAIADSMDTQPAAAVA